MRTVCPKCKELIDTEDLIWYEEDCMEHDLDEVIENAIENFKFRKDSKSTDKNIPL